MFDRYFILSLVVLGLSMFYYMKYFLIIKFNYFKIQENVQSVLASEPQVTKLMDQLETAIQEIEKVESALDMYDETLRHVRDTIDKMDQKNANIQTANKNNEKLLNELQKVIVSTNESLSSKIHFENKYLIYL